MSAFLRGPRVALHATHAPAPAGPGAWLPAGPAAPGLDEILLEVRPREGGAGLAVVGLSGVDWVARTARVCAGPLGGAGLDGARLAEALALVVRYAFEELGLERLDAAPRDADARAALETAGFAPIGSAGLHARHAPRPPPSR